MKNKENKLFQFICSTILTAGCIYAFNKFYSMYAVRKKVLSAKPEDFFVWKGLKVFYHRSGSGSPLILLHTLHPAASSYEWHKMEDELSKHHTVYTIDLPGCGRSDKPRLHYTNFFYVSLLRDFMKDMSLRGAAVVASNLTSAVAVMAAAYDPALIGKIVLINPPSSDALAEVPDFKSKLLMAVLNQPIIGSFIYNLLSCKPQIDLAFTEQYFYNPFHDNEELVDIYFESAQLGFGNGHYFAGSLLGKLLNINIDHAAQNLRIPVKIIEGDSTVDADKTVEQWMELNASFQYVIIPFTRQLPQLEEPKKTIDEIISFTL